MQTWGRSLWAGTFAFIAHLLGQILKISLCAPAAAQILTQQYKPAIDDLCIAFRGALAHLPVLILFCCAYSPVALQQYQKSDFKWNAGVQSQVEWDSDCCCEAAEEILRR